MTYKAFTARLLATTALIAGFGSTAMAQETVGEVVVTARRVEERLQDVPISVTVFSQADISKLNMSNTGDLAKFTPSLVTNSRFGPDKASFAIRGFTQETNTSPSVGVYFADVVAPRNLGNVGGGNGAGPGTLFDLQNVQVLMGPQGTLFGRNTTGGAILLVPQKPTRSQEGYVELSGGNYNMQRLQAVVNVPINERVRARFGIDQFQRKGYMENHGLGPDDFADLRYVAVRGSLVVDITENLENYTVVNYAESRSHGVIPRIGYCQRNPLLRGALAGFMADAACDQLDRQTARGDDVYDVESAFSNPASNVDQLQAINTTTWDMGPALTVRNIASYSTYQDRYLAATTGEYLLLPATLNLVSGGVVRQVPTGAAAGTLYDFAGIGPYPGNWTTSQRTFTEELQFRGVAFDDRLNWQAGGYFETSQPIHESGQTSNFLSSCPDLLAPTQCRDILAPFAGNRATGNSTVRFARHFFYNRALYAQGTYKLTDQFSITAGGRYTWDEHKVKGGQLTYQLPPAPGVPANGVRSFCSNSLYFPGQVSATDPHQCTLRFVAKSDKPTWMIDAEYRPTSDITTWAKYARGYRQGLANYIAAGFEILGPEKVDSYELGVKSTFRGSVPGYANAVLFYNKLTNQQIQASANPRPGAPVGSSNTVINAGKSVMKGIELEAGVQPIEGLNLKASYTYLDTELKSINPPDLSNNPLFGSFAVNAAVGQSLPLASNNRYVLSADYTLPLNDDIGEVTLGVNYTYQTNFVFTSASPYGRVPGYGLMNLNATWRDVFGHPVDISAFATNVTNNTYFVTSGSSFTTTGYDSFIAGEPRMYGVRVKYRWGQ